MSDVVREQVDEALSEDQPRLLELAKEFLRGEGWCDVVVAETSDDSIHGAEEAHALVELMIQAYRIGIQTGVKLHDTAVAEAIKAMGGRQ